MLSKQSHWDRRQWPDFDARLNARMELADLPSGQDLLDQERPQEAGEALEPDGLA